MEAFSVSGSEMIVVGVYYLEIILLDNWLILLHRFVQRKVFMITHRACGLSSRSFLKSLLLKFCYLIYV